MRQRSFYSAQSEGDFDLNDKLLSDEKSIDAEMQITLGLLSAVHENSGASQRTLASELGIALGLTNAYLKRCVKKGLVKMAQAPANRYAYYLTPKGFAEKSYLTGQYLKQSFDFYRVARSECERLLQDCVSKQWRQIAIYGTGELAEIAIICCLRHKSDIIAVFDNKPLSENYLGIPVRSSLREKNDIEAVLLTDVAHPQASYHALAKHFPPPRIFVPPVLRVSRLNNDTEMFYL